MKNQSEFILKIIIFLIVTIDFIINKNYINTIVLISGLKSICLASENKKSNYIFGLINSFLSSYIFHINSLNILKILTIVIIIPYQILGLLIKKSNRKIRTLSKKSKIKTYYILVISFMLTLFTKLKLLTILDFFSSALNIIGLNLMVKNYKDCWNIWLINNLIDLVLWIILFTQNSSNSIIMLALCIIYLIINIKGIKVWNNKYIEKEE